MRIHVKLQPDLWYGEAAWFMNVPIQGPAYMHVNRCVEGVERVINGEKGWESDKGGWRDLYSDGREE